MSLWNIFEKMAYGAEHMFRQAIGDRQHELDDKKGLNKLIKAVELAMESGSKSSVHIHNASGETIYVLGAISRESAIADLGSTVLKTLVSLGTDVPGLVMSISRLDRILAVYHLLKGAGSLALSGVGFADRMGKVDPVQVGDQIRELLERQAMKIAPGQTVSAFDYWHNNPSRYTSPSGLADFWGSGANCSVLIVGESLNRQIVFDTNSNDSWIVKPNEVVRAKSGTTTQEDRAAGFYRFAASDRIPTGARLKPGEAIKSKNERYDFVFDESGVAILYQRAHKHAIEHSAFDDSKKLVAIGNKLRDALGLENVQLEKEIWRTDPRSVAPSELVLQDDGNLVMYEKSGRPIWASNTGGVPSALLLLDDNGRLVLQTAEGKEVWHAPAAPH